MSQKFFLSGTTCQSCEVVIEREVKKIEGIHSADVSHKNQTLILDADREIDSSEIMTLIEKHGYRVKNKPSKYHQGKRIDWKKVGGILVIILALYWFLGEIGLLTYSPSASEPAGLFAVLIIGLIASVSSCTAVVGGLVVAVSGQLAKEQKGKTLKEKLLPHLHFNTGRVLGFAGFGALIGFLGSSIELSPIMNGLFVLIIALFMILLGINLLDIFPNSIIKMPKWLSHKIHDLSESKNPFAPALLGALTFFLPCGFTQSMQLYALSLQDPIQSSAVMTVFALGTLPALLGIGSLTSSMSGKKLKRITQMAGAIVLVLGLSNAANGATLLGINPSFSSPSVSEAPAPLLENGKQLIQMEITNQLEYQPNVHTVIEGIPVEWEIYGGEFLGCANTLVSPGLGINTYLQSGINKVEFIPQKPGKYTFSCSMGMFRGTMIVTPAS